MVYEWLWYDNVLSVIAVKFMLRTKEARLQNRADQSACPHYRDVLMGTMASQITSLTIVYSNVDSGADQRKHQSSASLAFVRGIHRGPVNSPHKWSVTRKMCPFDDVIMNCREDGAFITSPHAPVCDTNSEDIAYGFNHYTTASIWTCQRSVESYVCHRTVK